MEMNLRLYIICIATVLALVTPSLADSNYTATVHGGVYESDTFEPLANAMVEVNSTPSQSMVAKIGVYSFELAPGDYSITAKYYQNGTLLYSGGEIVNIKEEGSYVKDLLLFPIYSEALMDSSAVNASEGTTKMNNSDSSSKTEESEIDSSTVNFLLIAFALMILLTGGYQFSRKHKKEEKGTSQESKAGYLTGSSSSPVNIPEPSERVLNKSIEPEKWQIPQANPEESVSVKKPEAELDSRTVVTGQVAESESKISVKEVEESEPKIPEKRAPAQREEEYLAQDEELAGPETEDNEIIVLEKAEDDPEIEIPAQEIEAPAAPKKKLPLPSDLQEVMDIIRGQGGRITQKDLRSKLRYSEGKVSLMLADLERRELIEKFKRGRGNVIIVKDEER